MISVGVGGAVVGDGVAIATDRLVATAGTVVAVRVPLGTLCEALGGAEGVAVSAGGVQIPDGPTDGSTSGPALASDATARVGGVGADCADTCGAAAVASPNAPATDPRAAVATSRRVSQRTGARCFTGCSASALVRRGHPWQHMGRTSTRRHTAPLASDRSRGSSSGPR